MAHIDPDQRQRTAREILWMAYLVQIAHGHRPALYQLHAATRSRMHATAMQVTRSREAAEEVVQDVFMYVWLNAASYDASRSGIMTWMMMLCRSRALDHLRALASRSRVEADGCDADDERDDRAGPERDCDQRQRASALRAAVGSLPRRKRELLVLHYYSELSYDEISQRTAMPAATVKTVIRRACGGLADHPLLTPWQSVTLAAPTC